VTNVQDAVRSKALICMYASDSRRGSQALPTQISRTTHCRPYRCHRHQTHGTHKEELEGLNLGIALSATRESPRLRGLSVALVWTVAKCLQQCENLVQDRCGLGGGQPATGKAAQQLTENASFRVGGDAENDSV
jgi:hypothetical protein